MDSQDLVFSEEIQKHAATLNGAETDTLVALIERGPLEDGDIPSKSARNELILKKLACIYDAKHGRHQAATNDGIRVYRCMFKGRTIAEAKANRLKLLAEV